MVEENNRVDKEVEVMSTIEIIECEKVEYVKKMEKYLEDLKNMKRSEAKKVAFQNLKNSGIIGENGEFTERYGYTKRILQKKG